MESLTHTKGGDMSKSNYRPISLLSITLKVLERAIYNQSNHYLRKADSDVFQAAI